MSNSSGYLIYWKNPRTGHRKWKTAKTLEKALRFRDNLLKQAKYLGVWVTKFKDI